MPAVTIVALFDLVMDKSEVGVNVSLSLAELFDRLGSVEPDGAATVAVFVIVPVAVLATVVFTVKVAVPLGNKLTVVLMFTFPLAAAQLDPTEAEQVHELITKLAGTVSVTCAPTTALGPELPTTMT